MVLSSSFLVAYTGSSHIAKGLKCYSDSKEPPRAGLSDILRILSSVENRLHIHILCSEVLPIYDFQ